MQDLPLSTHRAHDGICRPHFRFDLAQALQAFDSACIGMVEEQVLLESFSGAELAPGLVCGGSRGEYCRRAFVISWVHPHVYWAIARTLTRTAEA
jgi:hypothetical protein